MSSHLINIELTDIEVGYIKRNLSPGQTIENYCASLVKDDYVYIDEAASILKISTQHTRRLFLDGKIPGYKPWGPEGRVVFIPSELREHIRQSRIPTKREISEEASERLNAMSRKRRAKV